MHPEDQNELQSPAVDASIGLTWWTVDTLVGKPWVSAFQNFLRIENRMNIKEVMSQNVHGLLVLMQGISGS